MYAGIDLNRFLNVDVLSRYHYISIPKHTLRMPDIRSISIQISYYTIF